MRFKTNILYASLISAGLALGGCNSSSDDAPEKKVEVRTPASLVSASADNIDSNAHGLVSSTTVKGWIDNWENKRPSTIDKDGRLFIFQLGENTFGGVNGKYIKSAGKVITLNGSAIKFENTTRSDGVSNVPSAVPNGEAMDKVLKEIGLNPNKDMLLFTYGDTNNVLNATRLWYVMAYWGVDPKRMALMNGTVASQMTADYLSASASSPLNNGTTSVKDILYDATAINASMKDMMTVAGSTGNHLIIDSRSPGDFDGSSNKSSTEEKTCGDDGKQQCLSAFTGRIKGAQNINYTSLYANQAVDKKPTNDPVLDSGKFLSPADIKALYTTAGYADGKTIYTYCRTGARASVNTFVQMQVLGYPTAMYDASWIQWGKMANALNKESNYNLPENGNPNWRTDDSLSAGGSLAAPTSVVYHPDSKLVQQINGLNLAATATDAIIKADKAYKK